MKKMTNQIIVEEISKKRYKLIQEMEASWDEELLEYKIDKNSEIDQLEEYILGHLKNGKYNLPFDFIIEELTKLGWAPCILYDDNGHFAISSDGVQSISVDKQDQELTHFIEKDMWKDSLREALDYYLTNQ